MDLQTVRKVEVTVPCKGCDKLHKGEPESFKKEGWVSLFEFVGTNSMYLEKTAFTKVINDKNYRPRKFRSAEFICFCSVECFLKYEEKKLIAYIKNRETQGKRVLIPT